MHRNPWSTLPRACAPGLLASLCLLTAGAPGASSAQASSAQADAAPRKAQAPGYYRMMLGDIEITALCDGTFPLQADHVMKNVPPQALDAALARAFLGEPVEESVNGFLVRTAGKLVLIDTGAGVFFGPTLGRLVTNLEAAGYRPEDVDEIYITHMHGDHIGGLIAGGQPVFAHAVVRAEQREADYWLGPASRAAAPKEKDAGFEHAQQALAPYLAAGRFKPFKGDAALVPGIRPIAAPGHTPGHTVYRVESRGQTLLVWGDTMHVAAVQFGDLTAIDGYDLDTAEGLAERKKIFAEAAGQRDWIAGAHLSFPGLGHLRTAEAGYVYVPANYTSLQGIDGQ